MSPHTRTNEHRSSHTSAPLPKPRPHDQGNHRAIAERSDRDSEYIVENSGRDSPSTATAPCAVVTSSSKILWTSGRPYIRRTAWHAMVIGLSGVEWSDMGLLSMLGDRGGHEHDWHE